MKTIGDRLIIAFITHCVFVDSFFGAVLFSFPAGFFIMFFFLWLSIQKGGAGKGFWETK